jgi:hypothetical protein
VAASRLILARGGRLRCRGADKECRQREGVSGMLKQDEGVTRKRTTF